MMHYTILLSAVLKHTVIFRKLWKIAPLLLSLICGNVEFVCVNVCVYLQNSEIFDCQYFKGFMDFHPKVCRNLEVKCGYINKMYYF